MKDSWNEVSLFEIADNSSKSFVDGDWIESPYITNEGIRLIQTGNIGIGVFKNKSKKYISEDSFKFLRCTEVFSGDVLICRLAEPIGRACIVPKSNERFITSVDVSILRVSDEFSKELVYQYLNTKEFLKKAELLSGGSTRQRISRTNLGNIKFYLPPLPQQKKIAKILSTVDKVIEKTESAIAKYQAIKQGLMHDLFTRGIDVHTGKLRPTPQEAPELYQESVLGLIPLDWEVETLRDITNINQGLQIAISQRHKTEGENRFVYITIQYLNNLDSDSYKYYIENPTANVICYEDDILMVRTGNTGMIVTDIVGAFHNNFFKIDYNESVLKEFLVYFLKRDIIQDLILNYAGTTTIPDLKHSDFYKIPFNKPTIIEQKLIIDKLKAIDDKIQTEQQALAKYQQLKAGLLQDLLTGKVEVKV